MKAQRLNNIKWFLEDDELITVLKGFAFKEEAKRGYFTWDYKGGKIFIKFFREKGIIGALRNRLWPRGKREYWSGKRLLAMSILTPKPLGYGLSGTGSHIIQEWMEGDTFVNVFLNGKNRQELLLKLADFLKMLKVHKVLHNDLHLNNVIVHNEHLYLIDLHKMVMKRHFGIKDEISNLSRAITMLYDDMTAYEKELFFSQYGAKKSPLRPPFPEQNRFGTGLKGGWGDSQANDIQTLVEREMKRLWERWIRKKQERAFDNTSEIVARGDYAYMAGTETLANGEFIRLIKKDKKSTVERHSDHIRKTYRNRRRLQRAWKTHVALKYLNLSVTPQPFCVKTPSLFSKGYIAMEDLMGSGEELDRRLDRAYDRMGRHEKIAFIEGLSEFFVLLFRKKIAHRDLKGCNIFVLKDGGFLLLDVEDILFTEINGDRLKRMLIQLNTTIPKRVGMMDRMRFYLKVVRGSTIDKKQVFKDVKKESLKSEIVYEGVTGLRRESW